MVGGPRLKGPKTLVPKQVLVNRFLWRLPCRIGLECKQNELRGES